MGEASAREHRWIDVDDDLLSEDSQLCAECGTDSAADDAEAPCPGRANLHLYVTPDETEWVIAADEDDAWRVREDHTGEERDDFGETWWKELAPTDMLEIFVDADGDPTDPSEDGATTMNLSAAEWIARRGRGWLCTTEI